jgi:hypothetical protein
MVYSLVSARVNYMTYILLCQNIDFLNLQAVKCQVKDNDPNFKLAHVRTMAECILSWGNTKIL